MNKTLLIYLVSLTAKIIFNGRTTFLNVLANLNIVQLLKMHKFKLSQNIYSCSIQSYKLACISKFFRSINFHLLHQINGRLK